MTRAGGRLGWHGPCQALQSPDPLHVRVCSETHVSRGQRVMAAVFPTRSTGSTYGKDVLVLIWNNGPLGFLSANPAAL